MRVKRLQIANVRNLRKIELEFGGGANVLLGPNGAGKTSLVEAIYLLGRGRSYRSRRIGPLIRAGQPGLRVFGILEDGAGNDVRVGIERSSHKCTVRVNGQMVRQLSELAQVVPMVVLTPQSHEILERGPRVRRRLLDWGVFHVEHSFAETAIRYFRALKQRNAALRSSAGLVGHWEKTLVETAMAIHSARVRYLDALIPHVELLLAELPGACETKVAYRQGWPEGTTLVEALEGARDRDRVLGYTGVGVHQADILFSVNNRPMSEVASRGQQKLTIAAFQLAQARLLAAERGKRSIILVDDLAAELDRENGRALIEVLRTSGSQHLVTSVDETLWGMFDRAESRLFHVEHGAIVVE